MNTSRYKEFLFGLVNEETNYLLLFHALYAISVHTPRCRVLEIYKKFLNHPCPTIRLEVIDQIECLHNRLATSHNRAARKVLKQRLTELKRGPRFSHHARDIKFILDFVQLDSRKARKEHVPPIS